MIVVQTNNPRQSKLFQEDFQREGDSFAVPFKSIKTVQNVLDLINYEITQNQNQKEIYHLLDPDCLKKIKANVLLLIKNILHLKLPLDIFRETLSLLVEQQIVYKNFVDHAMSIDAILEEDWSPEIQKYSSNVHQDLEIENDHQIPNRKLSNHLRLQILESPKFNCSNYEQKCKFQEYSPHTPSNTSQKDHETTSTMHETPQRFNTGLLMAQCHHNSGVYDVNDKIRQFSHESEFISSKIAPIPSVLLDQSISSMAKQQYRNDVERSKAILNSLKKQNINNDENSKKSKEKSIEEKLYSESIKMIKMQQKLRSSSNKTSNKSLKGSINQLTIKKESSNNLNGTFVTNKKNRGSGIVNRKNALIQQHKGQHIKNMNQPQKPVHRKALFNFFKSSNAPE